MSLPAALLTGIDEIDSQHQILFDCIGRLQASVSSEDRLTAVHFALEELDDFVRIHFAVEESLMRIFGYPLLTAHIAEHRQFANELVRLKEESLRTEVSEEMLTFLTNWLIDHIGKTDHQYVPHVRATLTVTGVPEVA
jgi:hemerythrin